MEKQVPEGLSPLRYEVDMLLKKYHAESVLQMLVTACENLVPAGYLQEAGELPVAGNWCGIYTTLFKPLALTLGINEKTKKKWKSYVAKA